MPPSYFPLRWESTGDQWWYASPIDFAAANGHYDLVRELLHIDTNLLIKLTSLRRIRRLESVWDDEEKFNDVAKCRSFVAKKLLLACETKKGHNTLIRAGYGGWLLYTAASAGDVNFVKELLERDPLLVFGEGEYGVTDILYAAARSKDSEVFRTLLATSVSLRKDLASGEEMEGKIDDSLSEFKREMMNRAVLSAARGGNLEILKELLGDCSNVLAYSDAQGFTILHAASGRGQVEVVQDIISSYDIINATDYQGNTALHVAAYRGHLPVVEILISASPTLTSQTNNYGDTFLHAAVSGFRSPGFRRVDRQVELINKIVDGSVVNIREIINVRNNDGRTALHLAVIDNIQSNLVELLMSVPSINLNIRDMDGMTALDILKQRPRTVSSEILIKQLISAGGISDSQDNVVRSAIASHLRGHGMQSPGTSFKVSDAEIFLYTGIENASDVSCELSSVGYSSCLSHLSESDAASSMDNKTSNSVNTAARRLKSFLHWTKKKQKKSDASEFGDDDSLESFRLNTNLRNNPIPLRQRYSNMASFSGNLRADSFSRPLPSPMTRKKFTAGLTRGVIQTQHFPDSVGSPSSQFSGSSMNSPPSSDKEKGNNKIKKLSSSNRPLKDKKGSPNKKMMNKYFCFGAQGLAVEESIRYSHRQPLPIRGFKRAASSVA